MGVRERSSGSSQPWNWGGRFSANACRDSIRSDLAPWSCSRDASASRSASSAGRIVRIIANNNEHPGGSIESFGSDKAARFAKLCDSWNIPIVTMVDTPGMMIGPETEKTALVRRTSNLIVTLGNVQTPRFSAVLRKCYGLGSNTILFGSERGPSFTVAWPTAEFGGMNLEAGVRLSYRDHLAAIENIEERAAEHERRVAEAYERGSALNAASTFKVDAVIDPVETRHWIVQGLPAAPRSEPIRHGRGPSLPAW